MASQTRKITIDMAALFFGRFVGLLAGMVRLNYVATALGVANFGIINFASYFCSLFLVLFDFGVSQLLIRELAREPARSMEYVGKIILLKLGIVFFASLIVGAVGFVSLFDRVTNLAILFTTAVFAINGLSMVFLSTFQAHRRMTVVSLTNIVNDLLLSVTIILLIRSYPSVMTILLLSLIIALINFVILLMLYIREFGMPHFHVDRALWRLFLRESAPIALSSVGISTYTFTGSTILKYTRGDTEVGIFSAGYKLISILTLIPTTISQVVYPIFSDFFENATQKLAKSLQDAMRVMAQISVPLAVGTVILAPRIIALLYPVSFKEASIVLQLMIIGNAFVYLAWISYSFLLAINRQKYCMSTSLIVAATSVCLNAVLVPRFGYVGVATTSLITDLTLFVFYVSYTTAIGYRIHDLKNYLKIILSAFSMGAFLFFAKDWYFIPLVLSGIAIYFALLLVLRVLGDQEKEILVKLFNRQ